MSSSWGKYVDIPGGTLMASHTLTQSARSHTTGRCVDTVGEAGRHVFSLDRGQRRRGAVCRMKHTSLSRSAEVFKSRFSQIRFEKLRSEPFSLSVTGPIGNRKRGVTHSWGLVVIETGSYRQLVNNTAWMLWCGQFDQTFPQ